MSEWNEDMLKNHPLSAIATINGQEKVIKALSDKINTLKDINKAAPEMYKFLDDLANGRGTDYPIEQLLAKARGEK